MDVHGFARQLRLSWETLFLVQIGVRSAPCVFSLGPGSRNSGEGGFSHGDVTVQEGRANHLCSCHAHYPVIAKASHVTKSNISEAGIFFSVGRNRGE